MDLVDPNTFQNTMSLPDRMRVFEKHLLSNLPSKLGIIKSSDKEYLPEHFVSQSIQSYHSPPQLSIFHDASVFENSKKVFSSPQIKLPLTYFDKDIITGPIKFQIPQK